MKYKGDVAVTRIPEMADARRASGPFMARRFVIAAAFVLAVALILLAGNAQDRQVHALESSSDWVRQTRDVELDLSQLLTTLTEAESAVRGYTLTGQIKYLPPFLSAKSDVPQRIALLRSQTAARPLGSLVQDRSALLAP